jgi:PAS domain S-box-containing protein
MPDGTNSERVRPRLRYGVACIAALATLLLRYALVQHFGIALPPFVLFYPIILTVALFGGFRAGVVVTVILTLLSHHAEFLTRGRLATPARTEVMATAIFFVLGLFVCTLVDRYRYLLRRDEMRYRSLFENMAEGLSYCKILLDADGRPVDFLFIEQNQAFCEMTGLHNPEGKRISQMVPEIQEDNPELIETYGRVATTGRSEHFEIYRKPPRDKWFSIMAYSPKAKYFVAVLQDITERKQADQRIAHLASFPELNPSAIFETDLEGRVTYVNPATAKQFPNFGQEGIEHALLKDWTSVIATLKDAEGSRIWREVVIDNLTLLQTISYVPTFKAVRSYCTDITERKQAEVEIIRAREAAEEATRQLAAEHDILDRERKILRTFIDNVPDVMFIKDTESRFVIANAATARWNGKSSYHELIGKTDYDCFSKEAADFYYESEQRLMREGKPLLNQERSTIDKETGEKRYALSNKIPLYDNEGRVTGLACIARIITEYKQAEAEAARLQEQLRQSQKLEAIGQLAGGISHDFNNLLMIIMAQTELLSQELDGVAAERAANVMKSAKRAANLTGQLLAFSRKQPNQPREFTINRLVSGVSDMLERLVGEDIDVLVSLCDEPWTVKIDRVQFEQVIMNLVLNARDAMPDGGRLTIETGNIEVRGEYVATHPLIPVGNYALLAVSDSGTGMDDEIRAHIFEPFFTTKEPGKGTGLGLSMVYGIVKQSGGFIWAYSELGKGTSFKIYLPKVEPVMAALPKTLAPTIPIIHKCATILLVEDEDGLRKIIGEFLLSAGHMVIAVANVEDAYQAAMEQRSEIEVMLTDVVLRGGNGRQLANRLLEQGCDFPVIYMSGYTSDAIVHHGVLDSGTLFLQKPFSRATLLAKVAQALSTRPQKA